MKKVVGLRLVNGRFMLRKVGRFCVFWASYIFVFRKFVVSLRPVRYDAEDDGHIGGGDGREGFA